MGRPEGLLGLVPFGSARHENRPTGRAWAVRQARWPVEARPDGTRAIRARALSGRAGPARCTSLIMTPGRAVHVGFVSISMVLHLRFAFE